MWIHIWVTLLQLSLMALADEVTGKFEVKVDPYEYVPCDDHWDVKYPYLVEVRYTATPGSRPYHHKYRHGALISHRAVLSRAQDLDKFPNTEKGEKVPTSDLKACVEGGNTNPCLYVNTRRPMDSRPIPQMCGQNIIVKDVNFHPKWTRTASDSRSELNLRFQNMKFPFAVLVLMADVNIRKDQTIFPALVLPRTPLDLMYLARRVATMGHDSKLCEFPHYNELKYGKGYYGPYDKPERVKVSPLDCKKDYKGYESDKRKENVTLCYELSLCPKDSSESTGCTWEGLAQPAGGDTRTACQKSLLWPNVHKNSLMVFFSTNYTFDETAEYDPAKRRNADAQLGSPIVCNGVGIGIVSSWVGRGWSRKDAYVGTSFLRGWRWILDRRRFYQDLSWHRARDDSPFLGEKYKFSTKKYSLRSYERSFFDISHDEQIALFGNSNKILGSITLTIFFIPLLMSY